ncbi:MAG TPA: type IV pilus twitching motility protein PilT [Pyrinomonadaceae bacterium]|nr:type IV pilus twitching motility protein PilT [Pyrinomonadaceae bacterium]
MEQLNQYLQTLMSCAGYELHLEPNKNPYVIAAGGQTDVANTPLLGTQISMMVFPLIPPDVKQNLPNLPTIQFVHPHNLGKFSFTLQKSPAGFNVTVRPLLGNEISSTRETAAAPDMTPQPVLSDPHVSDTNIFTVESSAVSRQINVTSPFDMAAVPDLLVEDRASMPKIEVDGGPAIEIVSANDPQFQTVFSDTSDYEPPGRWQDFEIQPDTFGSQFEKPVQEESPAPERRGMPTTVPPDVVLPPMDRRKTDRRKRNFIMTARMDALFNRMAEVGASDLHLAVSMPPMVRKDGKMQLLECAETTLTPESMEDLLHSIMPERNQDEFQNRSDTDFAYEIPGLARFRCNIFMDRKGMGGVFRIIPSKILTAQELGLSKASMDLCSLSKGLVVVTGPTGSGKSTTLCAMVDAINKEREDHIITIEDPIEFVHENQKCLVNQREVHNHTDSFKDALRAALREDPDIVLVGEMRDLETISIAIETAETGHLVFGTLHTTTAPSTVDRIIDQFPADRQQQIRVMLSESLKGVIAQTLLPKKGGGRVAALEILIITPAISNLIREGKTFQIPSAMQTGKNHGMVMLNDALFELVKKGVVEPRDAYVKAVDKTGFETMLTRAGLKL